MPESNEMCLKCDCPTGRAGEGDDSLYLEDGNGPFCEDCYEEYFVVGLPLSK